MLNDIKIRPNYQKFNQLLNDILVEAKTSRRNSIYFKDNPKVIQKWLVGN